MDRKATLSLIGRNLVSLEMNGAKKTRAIGGDAGGFLVFVYDRTSFKLKRKHVVNPRDMWIRANNAFPAIIEPALFARAQEIILARSKRYTDEEMLQALKQLWTSRGHISGLLIDEQESMPSCSAATAAFAATCC